MSDYNPSQYPTRKPHGKNAAEPLINSEFAEPGSDPTRGSQSKVIQSASSNGDHWRFSEGDVVTERFTVTERLGRGGMGEVYAVVDQLRNQARALKVMRASIDSADSSRERFLNESRVDDLRHPHIVRTIDIGEWKERKLLYITMELVDGQSLRELMSASERLTVVEKLTICYQICEALQFAHQHGIIHRDVKPDNVLVQRNEQGLHAWLTDFGIARLQTSGMTQTVASMGTPVYVAPEQQGSAAKVTGQADLYSVGAMLYELLTGVQPVGFFKTPSAYVIDLPKGIDELISDAMERLPEHRIIDAGTMAARIGKILKDLNQELKLVSNPQVDPASINLGDLVFEIQSRKAPQVTIDGVPDIPEVILELEGKRDQLQQTLELIAAGTHPLMKEHQVGLQKLSERVNSLQDQCQVKRPAGISDSEDEQLKALILAGERGPSKMLKVVPEANPEQLFQYVEVLINSLNAEQALKTTQKKYETQIDSETQRLEKELQESKIQLVVKRKQDLETQIRAFFETFHQQHPQDESFPYSAWGKFQGDVLAKRRYQLTPLEMTILAERCFDDPQNIQSDGDALIKGNLVSGTSSPELLTTQFDAEATSQTQQDCASELGLDLEISNSIGMKFRLIPPGIFLMGSPESEANRRSDELQHEVRITSPYYLSSTVVTQGHWKSVMGTTPWKGREYVKEGDNYPAVYVSWKETQKFINKLSALEGDYYRLPTEAEWEYACRAGSLSVYYFGDDPECLSEYGWFRDNTWDKNEKYAHQVGKKRPNPFGLYDMHGNVWEWCRDWYGKYSIGAVSDPTGPEACSGRVYRGGGCIGGSSSCRSAIRSRYSPKNRDYYLGFRVLRSSIK
ncbi:SUMF1/EgtB/PvdO family nonheme iron enzyme [Gimesia sp.]|uniref:bifunctional serine/threonine-protein kinase/formylglycine-generating enzyme family protein n=1 Tax=Gimesia sp. TaxID=2024833 RepID=UPI003A8E7636